MLSNALLSLARAAVSGASGQIIGDLNDYVLSAAALCAVGSNPAELEAAVWQARRA